MAKDSTRHKRNLAQSHEPATCFDPSPIADVVSLFVVSGSEDDLAVIRGRVACGGPRGQARRQERVGMQ